jgi:ATP-dependent RNA circularization protein (DNA/RNA ligase family)
VNTLDYPKIETLYNRDDKFKVIPTEIRMPEFSLVNRWVITEKVDGTNVRVALHPDGTVEFGGRTNDAQMPTFLLEYLQRTFTPDKMKEAFQPESLVILFGEGYGPKIQKGGNYSDRIGFRLFDCVVAGDIPGGWWWMEDQSIKNIADNLGILTVPYITTIDCLPTSLADLAEILGSSVVSMQDIGRHDYTPEGIIARTSPMLFTRRGERVMWKLKYRDFKA